MSWSTSELRVRLAPLNRFKPSSKIFYWPFQGGTSFVDLLCFCSVLCLLCFVRVCLYVLCGHLLGKGWPLGSRLWCLLWVCHFPIGILGQVWYLIVSIPDLCTITYFYIRLNNHFSVFLCWCHVSVAANGFQKIAISLLKTKFLPNFNTIAPLWKSNSGDPRNFNILSHHSYNHFPFYWWGGVMGQFSLVFALPIRKRYLF